MSSTHANDNAALPKMNWLAVLAAMTVAALAIYFVTASLVNKTEYGRKVQAAPAAAPHAE